MDANISKGIEEFIRRNLDEICRLRADRTVKEDGSYVTKGDLLCEQLVTDYIRSLPDEYEVISEEMDLSCFVYNPEKNYVVLDPIDGTENFTSGLKEWGISVSVYKGGTHVESMIMLPELNLQIMTGDKVKKYQSRICGLSSSLSKQHFLELEDGIEYRVMGCCVFNMYNVISGSYATFENPKGARAWDILAGLNLALEHGLEVLVNREKYNGGFLDPSKKYRFKIGHAS